LQDKGWGKSIGGYENLRMKKINLAIFYCQNQSKAIEEIKKALTGSDGLHIRQVALPCSGKLEVYYLIKALENGADGVLLFGCPEGACRYVVGSTRAKGRVAYTERILEAIGLEKDRVRRFVLEDQLRPERLGEVARWVERIAAMGTLKNAESK
jgi:F420-non-reducing hydrogenase iron-sulfur subunit